MYIPDSKKCDWRSSNAWILRGFQRNIIIKTFKIEHNGKDF